MNNIQSSPSFGMAWKKPTGKSAEEFVKSYGLDSRVKMKAYKQFIAAQAKNKRFDIGYQHAPNSNFESFLVVTDNLTYTHTFFHSKKRSLGAEWVRQQKMQNKGIFYNIGINVRAFFKLFNQKNHLSATFEEAGNFANQSEKIAKATNKL